MRHYSKTLALVALTLASATALAGTVKISGAGTTYGYGIEANKDAVQKDTGVTLEISPSNTGKGLLDLERGVVQIAMASEPAEISIEAAKAAGSKLSASDVKFHDLAKTEMIVTIHASNPVSKLTADQLAGIFTGKITNWKDVGGKDAPIMVLTDAPASGTNAFLKKTIMNGADFGASRKPMDAIAKVASSLSNFPNAIAALGKNFVDKDSKLKAVDIGKKIERPLFLVTKGTLSADMEKVIKAFQAKIK